MVPIFNTTKDPYAPANPPSLDELSNLLSNQVVELEQTKLDLIAEPEGKGLNRVAKVDKDLAQANSGYFKLLNLYSSESQIKVYGEREWRERFVLLRDIRSADYSYYISEGYSERQAKDKAESFKKTVWDDYGKRHPFGSMVQSLFTSPWHYAVPGKIETLPGGKQTFRISSPEELKEIGCTWCIFDPDRITPKFVSDLGIVKWNRGDGRNKLGVLERIADPVAITKLKILIDSVDRLSKGVWLTRKPYTRTYEAWIGKLKASGEASGELRAACDVEQLYLPVQALGRILKITEGQSGDREQAKNHEEFVALGAKVSIYHSAHSAARANQHAQSGYNSELAQIQGLLIKLTALQNRMSKQWKRETPKEVKEHINKDYLAALLEVWKELSNSQNVQKVKAAGLASRVIQRPDHEKLIHPVREYQRLNSVYNQLRERLRDAIKKMGGQARSGIDLSQNINEAEKAVTSFRSELRAKIKAFEQLYEQHLNDRSQQSWRARSRDALLTPLLTGLNEFKARPFNTFYDRATRVAAEIAGMLEAFKGERDQAHKIRLKYAELDLLCAVKQIDAYFAELMSKTIGIEPVALDIITPYGKKLRGVAVDDQPFESDIYKQVFADYEELINKIRTIAERFEFYSGKVCDASKRTDIYEKLRKHLNQFDLARMIESPWESGASDGSA